MRVENIPVMGHVFTRNPFKVGTADLDEYSVTIQLDGPLVETIQKLVEDGAEIKAFHINIEMMAAHKKEPDDRT